jgi:GNAT superfamily N-acetyltransferase
MSTNTGTDAIVAATADAQHEQVHYRIVSGSEILLLKPLFDRLNWPAPDPDMAKVIVAQAGLGKDGVILGFSVVQFVTHAEPLWVHPSMRGTGVAEELVRQTVHYIEDDCKIKRYVVSAKPGSMAARIAVNNGMRPLGCEVFVKTIPE